jgi:thiamine-phosphate pyrophosphorylase
LTRQPVAKTMLFDVHQPSPPLIYLVTSGQTTALTTPATEDFTSVLKLVQAAVVARIDLVQIREKNMSASVLYELTAGAAQLTRNSTTKLLVNDRGDIAAAAGADGVHLAASSLPVAVVRRAFGDNFVIGASTHSLQEARLARAGGADFAVFGPVFDTESKRVYGDALGLNSLAIVCAELSSFAILAIGGITPDRVSTCIQAGARGIAAIGMFHDRDGLGDLADEIHRIRIKD